jgi:hypothetical protein
MGKEEDSALSHWWEFVKDPVKKWFKTRIANLFHRQIVEEGVTSLIIKKYKLINYTWLSTGRP